MLHLFGKTTLKADFWLHPKQLLVTLGSLIALTPLGSDTSSRKRAPELFRLLRFENIVELPSLFKNKTIWILTHRYVEIKWQTEVYGLLWLNGGLEVQ